jgi:hypothetical protein
LGISGFLIWESREKWNMGVALVASCRKYYKGEGGGFSHVWAIVSLVSPCMHVAHLCIKIAPTMH